MSITLKRPTKTVELCTDLSLQAEHERAVEALAAAERDDERDLRLGTRPKALDAAQAVRSIEDRMTEHILVFTLQAMPRKQWAELTAEHPPRDGDQMDAAYRVNTATFVDAAVPASVISVSRKTTDEPVEFDPADWTDLADEMTNGQWEAFAVAVFALNRTPAAPDFSKAASRVIRTYASK